MEHITAGATSSECASRKEEVQRKRLTLGHAAEASCSPYLSGAAVMRTQLEMANGNFANNTPRHIT